MADTNCRAWAQSKGNCGEQTTCCAQTGRSAQECDGNFYPSLGSYVINARGCALSKLAKIALQRLAKRLNRKEVDREPTSAGEAVDGTLEALSARLKVIPGMISPKQGVHHYLLAYAQSTPGDIVEVGSWQGRNTCFLAAACRDSQNGIVHAIDHFRGNPGKTQLYAVGKRDLSDLETSFRDNVQNAGLADYVVLHATEAQFVHLVEPIRMLFIDAEHSYDAVIADINRFTPLLVSDGIVAFDDYASSFPGVVAAVDEWLATVDAARPVITGATLAVRVRSVSRTA